VRKPIVGVIGPGEGATATDVDNAYQLGAAIATQGWIVLTGGRNVGVMDAASRGARSQGGLTIGILPAASPEALSEAVEIAILTDLGQARNNLNVLSSNIVVACGMGLGTASEVALALKQGKSVVLLSPDDRAYQFFASLARDRLFYASTAAVALQHLKRGIALTYSHRQASL
jgi:uncharacterized protein (TIGR00725 family)